MREPKYRAWILGKMYEVRQLTWTEDGLVVSTDGGFMTLPDENVVLMQYTGFKDKSGKDIYKDDIVETRSGSRYKIIWFKYTWALETIRDSGPAYIYPYITHGYLWTSNLRSGMANVIPSGNIADRLEVIGNSYENPTVG